MFDTHLSAPEDTHRGRGGALGGALLLAFGIVIAIIGAPVLATGLVAAGVNQGHLVDGYFASPTETYGTDARALTSPSIGRLTMDGGTQKLPFDLATIRLRAASAGSDVFVGIATTADIEAYLRGVDRTEIRNLEFAPFRVEYRHLAGSRVPMAPAGRNIWVASASGPGTQELKWTLAPGDWGVVVMNADASPGVNVDLQGAVHSDLMAPAATALILAGALLLLIGIPMLVVGAVTLGRANSRTRAVSTPQGPA